MKDKISVTAKILSWSEIIIAARIFLFTLPILIKNVFMADQALFEVHDWFVIVFTITALIYLLAGLSILVGSKIQGFIHVFALILVSLMTYALIKRAQLYGSVFENFYYVPLILSVLISIFMIIFRVAFKKGS